MISPRPSIARTQRPHLLLTGETAPGQRSVADVRHATQTGFAARIWQGLRDEAEEALRCEPYLPTSLCPGRAPHHAATGNRDFVIVDAVCRRLKNDALLWLLTSEDRYRRDALRQMEVVLDESLWVEWPDMAHASWEADLRTGMLLRAFGYAYDWLSPSLSPSERRWIIDGLDRRGLQPYLREVERGAWFTRTERMNNWNTVIVGGAGIAAMALGEDHPRSAEILAHAVEVMDAYLRNIGPDGEFDESVGYAGAMHVPVEFFAAHRCHAGGDVNRLADRLFSDFCRWYMYFTLPPGRSARFGDCGADTKPKAVIFSAVAAAARDGLLQWFYLNHAEPDLRSDWALEFLLFDPTIEPVHPGGRLPRGRAFTAHGAAWSSRTDWNPRETACVVYGKAGHGNECHGHHDAGQVCIDAWGKPLIVDLGHPAPSYPEDFFTPDRWRYYNAGVIGHNVLMFGGREMRMVADGDDEVSQSRFDSHSAGGWARAEVLASRFDDARGGYWQVDTTPLYDGALLVRRTVVHLHPAVVAVLDEAELECEDEISLRWHTFSPSSPDAEGRFLVANAGIHLASCVSRLDGEVRLRSRRHSYQPPFDRARLGPPLEQRREPYVEADCRGRSCRLLSLFGAFPAGVTPAAWSRQNDAFELRGGDSHVRVRITPETLIARDVTRAIEWSVPLGHDPRDRLAGTPAPSTMAASGQKSKDRYERI